MEEAPTARLCAGLMQVRPTLERNLMQCSTCWLSRVDQISNSRVSNGGILLTRS